MCCKFKNYDVLLVTRVFHIINTKQRIELRRMKTREIDENLFPSEIPSILQIDHRTTMGETYKPISMLIRNYFSIVLMKAIGTSFLAIIADLVLPGSLSTITIQQFIAALTCAGVSNSLN